MKKVSIKAYAVKHKLSIFNVMKMVKSGKLKTVINNENDKEVTYIILNDVTEVEVKERIVFPAKVSELNIYDTLEKLKIEVQQLRKEMDEIRHY